MVPLLEPPLLLERGWDDAEDRESPGMGGILGVGEGEGVSVGEVLLEVEEFPDWGRFFNSIFCKEGNSEWTVITCLILTILHNYGRKYGRRQLRATVNENLF